MLLKISQAQTKKSSTLAVGDEGAIADVDENVVQGADLHDPHREAAVACPDPECSLFFNERCSLWWHVKFEHFFAGGLPKQAEPKQRSETASHVYSSSHASRTWRRRCAAL